MKRQFKAILMISTGRCVYCGDYARERDHYLAWANHSSPYWIPACPQCNSALGSKEFVTLGDRAYHVYEYYIRKARDSYVAEGALKGTKGNLKNHLKAKLKEHRLFALKAEWALEVASVTEEFRLSVLHEDGSDKERLESLMVAMDYGTPLKEYH